MVIHEHLGVCFMGVHPCAVAAADSLYCNTLSLYGYTRTLECVFYGCTPVRCSCSQLSILLAACMFMGVHPCAECCVFVGKSLTVCFLSVVCSWVSR